MTSKSKCAGPPALHTSLTKTRPRPRLWHEHRGAAAGPGGWDSSRPAWEINFQTASGSRPMCRFRATSTSPSGLRTSSSAALQETEYQECRSTLTPGCHRQLGHVHRPCHIQYRDAGDETDARPFRLGSARARCPLMSSVVQPPRHRGIAGHRPHQPAGHDGCGHDPAGAPGACSADAAAQRCSPRDTTFGDGARSWKELPPS